MNANMNSCLSWWYQVALSLPHFYSCLIQFYKFMETRRASCLFERKLLLPFQSSELKAEQVAKACNLMLLQSAFSALTRRDFC